jgi:hypothetical protein
MMSKRATKETCACIYCIAIAVKANTHESRTLEELALGRTDQCHSGASCVKCHLCCHAIAGMSLDAIKVKRHVCSRIRGTAIA